MKHVSKEGPKNASMQQIWPVKNKNKCHDHFVSAFRLFSIPGDDMIEDNRSEVYEQQQGRAWHGFLKTVSGLSFSIKSGGYWGHKCQPARCGCAFLRLLGLFYQLQIVLPHFLYAHIHGHKEQWDWERDTAFAPTKLQSIPQKNAVLINCKLRFSSCPACQKHF